MTKPTRTFLSYTILSVIYLVLLVVLPANPITLHTYNLSVPEYRILSLLVSLPLIVVWFTAFYGYARLDHYSHSIQKTHDGKAFTRIAVGLRWLAWGLPLTAIVNSVADGITSAAPSFNAAGIIINHYMTLLISIVAFTVINVGAGMLVTATDRRLPLKSIRFLLFAYIALAVIYCYGTANLLLGQHSNPYHMPVWLILFTVLTPYLYAWLMGLSAAYGVNFYRKHVTGLLYKRALSLLAAGLGLAITSSAILQYISSSTGYLQRITFDWRLLVAYVVLLLYALGFSLIALGANKLKKIEEV